MSLPRRLYKLYRDAAACDLVKHSNTSEKALAEFKCILNEAQASDDTEIAQRALIWGMYQSNTAGCIAYISNPRNRVGALILWTESKRIANYFNLYGKAYVSWDKEEGYNVSQYNANQVTNTKQSEDEEENKRGRGGYENKRGRGGYENKRGRGRGGYENKRGRGRGRGGYENKRGGRAFRQRETSGHHFENNEYDGEMCYICSDVPVPVITESWADMVESCQSRPVSPLSPVTPVSYKIFQQPIMEELN
jgi:hypothetical protein